MAAAQSRLAYSTQKIVYQASDTGLVVSSTIHLDDIARDTKSVICELTPGLSPTSIMVDSTPVAWRAREVQHDGSLSIVIQLPHVESEGQIASDLSKTNRIIRIVGTATIPVGPQSLPRILLPQCEWMQETAFINVSEAVVVQSLRPTQCQQTEYSRNGTKSSYRFDYASADGSIEIQLGRSKDAVDIQTCTFVSLTDSVVSAKTEAEVSVQRGTAFSLHASVKEGWSIEGVDVGTIEGQSANLIDRWEEVGSDNDGNHQLLIRFRRPIEPSRPLRLSITSTRRVRKWGHAQRRRLGAFDISEWFRRRALRRR